MEKEHILSILERMRKNGELIDSTISAHINMMLRAGRIEEVYELLERGNLLIILRSVMRQYIKLDKDVDLKLDYFDKVVFIKRLKNQAIIFFFKECLKRNTDKALQDFFDMCEIFRDYKYN